MRRLNPADRSSSDKGDDEAAPFEVVPFTGRTRQIAGHELERIEIKLAADDDPSQGSRYQGYHIVGGERRPLPIGSTLDAATGRFYWQPGAGFIGAYDLLFVRIMPDGRSERIAVQIVLQPRHRNASDVQMAIDMPVPGDVPSTFLVAGWAIDRGAQSASASTPFMSGRTRTPDPARSRSSSARRARAPAGQTWARTSVSASRTLSTGSSSRGSRQGCTTSSSSRTAPSPRSSSLPRWCG